MDISIKYKSVENIKVKFQCYEIFANFFKNIYISIEKNKKT